MAKEMEACKSAQEQAALSLSDRERRAMAAEKRMVSSQSVPSSSIITRYSRFSGILQLFNPIVAHTRVHLKIHYFVHVQKLLLRLKVPWGGGGG